ncbi:MAG: ATP-dependent 6-phosphofructokinase [Oscillospiraceae bacterium]|nr:ATP-dependent 6-phosphofructokinase [Oscillospiraceae bacterium]MDD4368403.1 ATP-dependent 6-phosphofructokinase [Oscillospiraceae bacterium]
MLRVGLLTSGGDCQGLNAALRGVAKTLYEQDDDVEIYGFFGGYKGLIESDYQFMNSGQFSGILTQGGTILGTSRQPFKQMNDPIAEGSPVSKKDAMIATYHRLNLDCLIILGGNGTHKTANALSKAGLNIITLPKTIDNDLWATDMTFGFQSAVNIATQVIDGIHTTATSHGRIFIIELMGHNAGWLTLNAGVAGGADIILIPEIPYSVDSVIKALEARSKAKKSFSIIAMAEGALNEKEAALSKKDFKKYMEAYPYPSVSYKLADELNQHLDQEVRVTVPGHFQRGGAPCPQDRVLATRCGCKAAELIFAREFGVMVGVRNNEMVAIPLEDVAGKLKTVPRDHDLIRFARGLGIAFGDESY